MDLLEISMATLAKKELEKTEKNEITNVIIRALDCYIQKMESDWYDEVLERLGGLLS